MVRLCRFRCHKRPRVDGLNARVCRCAGHMLVANIALQFVSPTTLDNVKKLAAVLGQWYTNTPGQCVSS